MATNAQTTSVGAASTSQPDFTRSDVGLVLVSEWSVGTAERQHAAVEASMAAWDSGPWPEALLAHHCLVSTDGASVLHYSQWTNEEGHRRFVETDMPERFQSISDRVPGIERHGVEYYRLYRSTPAGEGAPEPGCIVLITVETDGPDRQREWVDAVFDALESDAEDAEADNETLNGGIAAHFHLSTDGSRVINYAEWTDEEAHQAAMESPATSDAWRRVHEMPGVTPVSMRRYWHVRSRSRR